MSTNAPYGCSDSLGNLYNNLKHLPLDDKLQDLLIRVDFIIKRCEFGAQILFDENTIVLDPSLFDGSNLTTYAVQSSLFELINLSHKREFRSLVNRIQQFNLTPDEFVEEYERIEYDSAARCQEILQKTIPPEHWDTYPMIYTTKSFELHYLLQQHKGHSQKIYQLHKNYFNRNQTYRGSWRVPSEIKDRKILSDLFNLKIGSEIPVTDFGKSAGPTYQRLKSALQSASPAYDHLMPSIEKIERAARSITPR